MHFESASLRLLGAFRDSPQKIVPFQAEALKPRSSHQPDRAYVGEGFHTDTRFYGKATKSLACFFLRIPWRELRRSRRPKTGHRAA